MWQRVVAKFGNDSIDESPQQNRTMGFGNAITMWLGANVVVTTILTGMLLVPDLPYVRALWIVLAGSVVGAVGLALVGNMGTPGPGSQRWCSPGGRSAPGAATFRPQSTS